MHPRPGRSVASPAVARDRRRSDRRTARCRRPQCPPARGRSAPRGGRSRRHSRRDAAARTRRQAP
ncbi:hypothetical protein ACFPRL_00750 [Pseudoclavibacter helvolus]